MSKKVGSRVGAIQKADKDSVHFYGWGVYEGDFVPQRGFMKGSSITNPQIKLDNGKLVWGCECWWGPEDKVKEMIGDRKVINVEVEE